MREGGERIDLRLVERAAEEVLFGGGGASRASRRNPARRACRGRGCGGIDPKFSRKALQFEFCADCRERRRVGPGKFVRFPIRLNGHIGADCGEEL